MIRIDENTYIDDSLITCAEYQLFIDEMRTQGKYYQPGHWISYQFPDGQGKEPILGVRNSDATAFCDWLTNREGKDWKYRPPVQQEVGFSPLPEPAGNNLLGYWIENEPKFTWVGSIPKNARGNTLDTAKTIALDYVRQHLYDVSRSSDFQMLLDWGRLFNLPFSIALAFIRSHNYKEEIGRLIARTRNRKKDAIRNQDIDNTCERVKIKFLDLDYVYDYATDIHYNPAKPYEEDITFAFDRAHSFGRERDLALELIRKYVLSNAIDLGEPTQEFYLELFFDIYTLQERIAGRSPAFEGIRIVKERVKS
jgi:hypothetical protein